MKYQIEVDEEVYRFLQKEATPFEDTPNTVLRRLLLTGKNNIQRSDSRNIEFPKSLKSSLQQILEVTYLCVKFKLSRIEATKRVATKRNIAPQTVIDKYTRQLGLRAYEFEELLQLNNLEKLKFKLIEKFPEYEKTIIEFFNEIY